MKTAACLYFACSLAALAETPYAWTPEFSSKFQQVRTAVPSPDGKWVAYTQSRTIIETERSEINTQVFLAASDSSRRIQLTRGEKSAIGPAWSPDGRYIYFLSDRTGKRNVFRIQVRGGEAESITEFKGAVSSFRVSPDGRQIAFTGYEPPADLEKARKEKRDFHVVGADPGNDLLYVVPAEPDASDKRPQRKLTSEGSVTSFEWSPDSGHIAYTHQPRALADDWTRSDISEVDVTSGKITPVAATAAAETAPAYSPDGRYLAFARTPVPVKWAAQSRIVLVTRGASTPPRELPATHDDQPDIIGFTADSKNILFNESAGTRNVIYAMPVDGPPRVLYRPSTGTVSLAPSLNTTATHLAFPQESPDRAPEAFLLPVSGGAPVQVSQANTAIPLPAVGRTEVIRWKSRDGLEIEGLLTYPVNYEKGRRYPLLLNIHGGPTGVFLETFIGRPGVYPIAAFAERGYAILRPNPRGSSGYGQKFRFANYNDWGGRDYEDDQSGVDKVIELGVADPDRLGIMGWSYGGYMTSWTITQTNRFKAAAVGAGVTNLWSFTGTADIPGFLPDYFGGEPWETFDNWAKHSPITYIRNVRTPTLILHGEADDRVPISQGFEYYHALKTQGVTTRMVTYPRTPHGPSEPKFVMDIMQRHLDWMERYVK